jgi:hypothetical protein
VEGDDGVDQGKTVLPQARLADGDALPGSPAGPRLKFAGGGGFGETLWRAVPVALLAAVGPADKGRGFGEQVAQRTPDVVGVLLVGQQQRLELAGCGQAHLREGEQDLAADLRTGPSSPPPCGPGTLFQVHQ